VHLKKNLHNMTVYSNWRGVSVCISNFVNKIMKSVHTIWQYYLSSWKYCYGHKRQLQVQVYKREKESELTMVFDF